MSEVTQYEPGTFCWAELATSDPDGAKRFYTGLFGWTVNEMPMGDGSFYSMVQLRGLDAGALYGMRKEQREQGVPPNWMSYFSVVSADETARKAKELGGKVLAEPFDVFDVGRMAVLQDPAGATFSIWQPKRNIGARVNNEPGAFCWSELDTDDTEKAKGFYTRLFEWGTKVGGEYTEWLQGGRSIGGMMKIPPEWGAVSPNWLTYLAVADCDATARKAQELGGQAIVPPTDIPDVGRFAVLRDPQGAVFAVVRLG